MTLKEEPLENHEPEPRMLLALLMLTLKQKDNKLRYA